MGSLQFLLWLAESESNPIFTHCLQAAVWQELKRPPDGVRRQLPCGVAALACQAARGGLASPSSLTISLYINLADRGTGTPTMPVSLHTHSWYSLLEGVTGIEALLQRAAALGYSSLALTDSNNLYGVVAFTELAHRYGV